MKDFIIKLKKSMNFVLSRISALFLITMTCLVLYQVFTRYVLNSPSDFTEEIVRYLLVWTGFIGAAYAFNTRQHMSLVFFKEKLSKEKQKWLSVVIDFIILLFALLIMVIGGWTLSISTMGALSALLSVPRGLVYLIGPISGIFIIIGQIINIWEDINETVINLEEEDI